VSRVSSRRRPKKYKPETGAGNFIELEMGKNAAPRVLATLEARSGKKIDRAGGS
jgi:hypothetical protein